MYLYMLAVYIVYYPLMTCFTDLGMTRNFVRFLENPPSPYFEGNAAG